MGTWRAAASAILIAGCGTISSGAEIKPGDDLEAVFGALGKPSGYIRLGDVEAYYYERGEVRIQNGEVVLVDLISAEEAQTRREERERRRVEQARLLKERQARRSAEGETLLALKLTDAGFALLPASQRAAFWSGFRSRYPEVDVTSLYVETLTEAERDAERVYMERRVTEMEARVREAEEKARRAERAAYNARRSSYIWPYNYNAFIPVHRSAEKITCPPVAAMEHTSGTMAFNQPLTFKLSAGYGFNNGRGYGFRYLSEPASRRGFHRSLEQHRRGPLRPFK